MVNTLEEAVRNFKALLAKKLRAERSGKGASATSIGIEIKGAIKSLDLSDQDLARLEREARREYDIPTAEVIATTRS